MKLPFYVHRYVRIEQHKFISTKLVFVCFCAAVFYNSLLWNGDIVSCKRKVISIHFVEDFHKPRTFLVSRDAFVTIIGVNHLSYPIYLIYLEKTIFGITFLRKIALVDFFWIKEFLYGNNFNIRIQCLNNANPTNIRIHDPRRKESNAHIDTVKKGNKEQIKRIYRSQCINQTMLPKLKIYICSLLFCVLPPPSHLSLLSQTRTEWEEE